MVAVPSLWDNPPPTGPQSEVPTKAMNKYSAYQVWRRSEDGGKAMGWMLVEAQRRLEGGAKRISTKALVELMRGRQPGTLNNTWTCWIADDLVAADQRLLDVIERRVRKKAKV